MSPVLNFSVKTPKIPVKASAKDKIPNPSALIACNVPDEEEANAIFKLV